MEIKIFLAVAFAVISIIGKLMKKSPEKQASRPTYRPKPQVRVPQTPSSAPAAKPTKHLTFEELLKEIAESKSSTQPVATTTAKSSSPAPKKYVDYDDDLQDEEQDLEDVTYDYRKKDKIYDVYEDAKRQAFNRPSLEETMNVRDTDVRYARFREFEQETRRDLISEYLGDLNDPKGFKKAVVMSEILQRKF